VQPRDAHEVRHAGAVEELSIEMASDIIQRGMLSAIFNNE
jgi:hypothetical protein